MTGQVEEEEPTIAVAKGIHPDFASFANSRHLLFGGTISM